MFCRDIIYRVYLERQKNILLIKVQLTKLICQNSPTLNLGKVLELQLPKSDIAIGGNGLNAGDIKQQRVGFPQSNGIQ